MYWNRVGHETPARLVAARQLAHQAVQWVTRAARSALEPQPDDSHSNLGWSSDHVALMSHDLPGHAGPFRLGLRLPDLTLISVDRRGMERFPLHGKTEADAANWVAAQLTEAGLEIYRLDEPLPYSLDNLPVAPDQPYEVTPVRGALGDLALWYANAATLLGAFTVDRIREEPGPTPVRCWPHHFDIATLVRLEEGDPETVRSIGCGLSPGDGMISEPYFYISPWPQISPEDLPDLRDPGRWQVGDGFVGAVIPASDIAGREDPARAVTAAFNDAYEKARSRLMG